MSKRSLLSRVLIYIGGALLLIVLLGVTAVQVVSQRKLNATFDQAAQALPITPGDAAATARGEYLVNSVFGCGFGDCHRPDFGGGPVIDTTLMGLVYAPNLTTGQGSVTLDYTGEDWSRILRHGLKRDRRRALVMPTEDYLKFSDADLAAAVSYIATRPPVDRPAVAHSPGMLLRLLLSVGAVEFGYDTIDHTKAPPAAAVPGPTSEWGGVLIGTCTGCHGASLSGGPIPGADPSWPAARNISPDDATGIGRWSFEDFDTAMRKGKRPDGTDVRPPMPWQLYINMSEDDMTALWSYLRSVPARTEGGR